MTWAIVIPKACYCLGKYLDFSTGGLQRILDRIASKILQHNGIMIRVRDAENTFALKIFPIRKAYTLAGGGLTRNIIKPALPFFGAAVFCKRFFDPHSRSYASQNVMVAFGLTNGVDGLVHDHLKRVLWC